LTRISDSADKQHFFVDDARMPWVESNGYGLIDFPAPAGVVGQQRCYTACGGGHHSNGQMVWHSSCLGQQRRHQGVYAIH